MSERGSEGARSFYLSPCLPFPFNCLPVLFICLPHWMLVVGFPAGLSPTSLHLSPTFSPNSLLLGVLNSFLRCVRPLCRCWCPPISTGRWSCSISSHLSPWSVTAGVRPSSLNWRCDIYIHLSPRSVTAGVVICLPALSLLVSAIFRWPRNSSIVLFICFPILSRWCPPFSAGPVAFLFVCLPGLSLLASALFRWPCSISIRES